MLNLKQDWYTDLIASRMHAEGGITIVHELRETHEIGTRYISARVIVNNRQVRHRHIVFEDNAAATAAFEALQPGRDMNDDDAPDVFWTKLGASEVRICGNDPIPPGGEHLEQR
jgi:hypothetical protein